MVERCLVFIKPEHYLLGKEILEKVEEYCLKVNGRRVRTTDVTVPEWVAKAHYHEHEGKAHYPRLLRQLTGKVVRVAVYEGNEGLCEAINEIVGVTDPVKAKPGTIRHDYCRGESVKLSTQEDRGTANAIHRSANQKAAKIEIMVWQPFLDNYFVDFSSDLFQDRLEGLEEIASAT